MNLQFKCNKNDMSVVANNFFKHKIHTISYHALVGPGTKLRFNPNPNPTHQNPLKSEGNH